MNVFPASSAEPVGIRFYEMHPVFLKPICATRIFETAGRRDNFFLILMRIAMKMGNIVAYRLIAKSEYANLA